MDQSQLTKRKRIFLITITGLFLTPIISSAWWKLSSTGFAIFVLVGALIFGLAEQFVKEGREKGHP